MELKMKTESHSAASEEVHSAGGDGNPGKVSQPEQVTAPLSVSSEYAFLAPGSLYVDKTLMVKELMDEYPDKGVLLLARPHGFGKTFLLKTLRAFFERPGTASDVPASMDTSLLFQNRKIGPAGRNTGGNRESIRFSIFRFEMRKHPRGENSAESSLVSCRRRRADILSWSTAKSAAGLTLSTIRN